MYKVPSINVHCLNRRVSSTQGSLTRIPPHLCIVGPTTVPSSTRSYGIILWAQNRLKTSVCWRSLDTQHGKPRWHTAPTPSMFLAMLEISTSNIIMYLSTLQTIKQAHKAACLLLRGYYKHCHTLKRMWSVVPQNGAEVLYRAYLVILPPIKCTVHHNLTFIELVQVSGHLCR